MKYLILTLLLTSCTSTSYMREYADRLEELSQDYRANKISASKLEEEVSAISRAMKVRAFLENDYRIEGDD